MNKTYRIVFSPSRGATVEVKEVAKSHIKSGKFAKTLIASAVALTAGMAMAATEGSWEFSGTDSKVLTEDTKIVADKDSESGRVTAIFVTGNTNASVDTGEHTLTLEADATNQRAYLFNIPTNNPDSQFIFNGTLVGTATATSNSNQEVRLFRINAGKATFSGDINVTGKATGGAIGIDAWYDSEIDFSKASLTVNLDASSGYVRGMQVRNNFTNAIVGDATFNLNVSANATSPNRWVLGVDSAQSTTTFKGKTVFNVTSLTEDKQSVQNDIYTAVRVISAEGSGYKTEITFEDTLDINVDTSLYDVTGFYSSGDSASSTDLHSIIRAKHVDLTITGTSQYTTGALAQGHAEIIADSMNIDITADKVGSQATGLLSSIYGGNGGHIKINDALDLDMDGVGKLYGIVSQSRNSNIDHSTVDVLGNARIDVNSSQSDAVGIFSTTGGKLTLSGDVNTINVTGYEKATGVAITSKAMDAYKSSLTIGGNTTIEVKTTAEDSYSVGIDNAYGTFNVTGQTTSNADVAYTGTVLSNAYVTSTDDADAKLTLNGTVSNKGKFSLTDADLVVNSGVGTKSDLGSVSTVGEGESAVYLGAGEYTMSYFEGQNKRMVLTDLANTDGVKITNKRGDMTLVADANSNDQYANAQETLNAITEKVDFDVEGEDETVGNEVVIEQSTLNDGMTGKWTKSGFTAESYTKNSFVDGFGSVSSLSALQWRHEMNSLNKRMGELRDAPAGVGSWVRLYGSEMEYGAQSIESKNTTIQVGSDVSVGDWKFGIAANYTDGDSTYDNGDADTKNFGIALYGSWLAPCGGYLDLIAKYSRLDNDFVMNSHKGSYDNNAFSFSAELGHHFTFVEDRVFVEPQLGLAYGYINSADFKTNDGIRIQQDSFESLIGRIGVRTGFTFPDNKGSVYARVSGVYDFKGELDSQFSLDGSASRNFAHDDLGGSWVEYGVGANFNWSENTYTYVDLERTSGGEVRENYRWNIGLRHVF